MSLCVCACACMYVSELQVCIACACVCVLHVRVYVVSVCRCECVCACVCVCYMYECVTVCADVHVAYACVFVYAACTCVVCRRACCMCVCSPVLRAGNKWLTIPGTLSLLEATPDSGNLWRPNKSVRAWAVLSCTRARGPHPADPAPSRPIRVAGGSAGSQRASAQPQRDARATHLATLRGAFRMRN